MGTEGRLLIDRGGYTYQERKQPGVAAPEPLVRKATGSLESYHVQNFLACMKSREKPNSDVVSGHRSALASHLCKIAYIEKKRIKFDPESEKKAV